MTGPARAVALPLLLAACALAPRAATAQPKAPINTDRPSFTSAPRVVGARVVQVETGLAVTREAIGEAVATTTTAPNALIRLGIDRRFEVRFEVVGWVRTAIGRPGAEAQSSVSDVAASVEYQFAAQDGLGVDLALIAGTSVPTGGRVSSGNADPFVRFVWNRGFGHTVSLGGTMNWLRLTVPGPSGREPLRTLEGSVILGHGLGGSWSAFWEAVVRHQDLKNDAVAWIGNAGVLKTFGRHLQVDAWVGHGLSDLAPDWTFGAGLSVRFHR